MGRGEHSVFEQLRHELTSCMDSPQIHEAEPEEQHEGGQDEPAVDELSTQTQSNEEGGASY